MAAYRPSQHRAAAEVGGVRVPGGDYDAYVESHVRRLEALRHAGIVERIDADRWLIPDGFKKRSAGKSSASCAAPTSPGNSAENWGSDLRGGLRICASTVAKGSTALSPFCKNLAPAEGAKFLSSFPWELSSGRAFWAGARLKGCISARAAGGFSH